MEAQVLDSMDSSASAASPSRRRPLVQYKARDGNVYNLNLIDTRALDFSYEFAQPFGLREAAGVDASQASRPRRCELLHGDRVGVDVVPV